MSRQPLWTALGAAAIALSLGTAVLAQTPVQPQPRDPNMPGQQNTLPEKMEPRTGQTTGETTGSTGTLSDKLQASDGVITPPANISPDMAVKPPVADPGTTRIIPPAGSPGSRQPNADPR